MSTIERLTDWLLGLCAVAGAVVSAALLALVVIDGVAK